jgi:DNA-binding FrmR family transcriptional regulator
MAHALHDKNRILARIRRIKGQTEALEKVVGQDADTGSVLQQIAAIRGAANGLLTVVLEGQLHEHAMSRVPAKRHHVEHRELLNLLRVCLK